MQMIDMPTIMHDKPYHKYNIITAPENKNMVSIGINFHYVLHIVQCSLLLLSS